MAAVTDMSEAEIVESIYRDICDRLCVIVQEQAAHVDALTTIIRKYCHHEPKSRTTVIEKFTKYARFR